MLPSGLSTMSHRTVVSKPEVLEAILLQFYSQNESTWIMSQFLTILRHTVKNCAPSGSKDLIEQGQPACPNLDCSMENSTLLTADHDANIDLLFFIRSLGNNLTSMAEQRISRINQAMQDGDADLPILRGQTDVVTASPMAEQIISLNKKIKQEVDADMPILKPQTDVVTTSVDVMSTSCFSDPEPETYYTFEDNKEDKQLIVIGDFKYGYKYTFKAQIGLVCMNCSARARVISDSGETVVKSMTHDCVPIQFKGPLQLTKHANIDQSQPPFSTDPLSQNAFRRHTKKRDTALPYLNRYKFFYFGLSYFLKTNTLFVKSNESTNFFEYQYIGLKYFICTYCKKLGERVCVKLCKNSILGQTHHPTCKGFPKAHHQALQTKRRALAKMSAKRVKIEAQSRFHIKY